MIPPQGCCDPYGLNIPDSQTKTQPLSTIVLSWWWKFKTLHKKLKQDEHDDELTMEIPDCQPKTPNIIENGVDLAMKIPDSPEGCRKEQKLW